MMDDTSCKFKKVLYLLGFLSPLGEAAINLVEDFTLLAGIVRLEATQIVDGILLLVLVIVDVAQQDKSFSKPVVVRCVALNQSVNALLGSGEVAVIILELSQHVGCFGSSLALGVGSKSFEVGSTGSVVITSAP